MSDTKNNTNNMHDKIRKEFESSTIEINYDVHNTIRDTDTGNIEVESRSDDIRPFVARAFMLVKNPLYDIFKKTASAFGFMILSLIVLSGLDMLKLDIVLPFIIGTSLFTIALISEIWGREYIKK